MNKRFKEFGLPYFVMFALICSLLGVYVFRVLHEMKQTPEERGSFSEFKRSIRKPTDDKSTMPFNKEVVLVQSVLIVETKGHKEKDLVSFKYAGYSLNLNKLGNYKIEFLPAGTKLFLTNELDERESGALFFKYKGEYIRFLRGREEFFKELFDPEFVAYDYENKWVQDVKDLQYNERVIQEAQKIKSSFKMNKCITLIDVKYGRTRHEYFKSDAFLNEIGESSFEYLKNVINMLQLDPKIKLYGYSVNKIFPQPALCVLVEFDDLVSYLAFRNLPQI